MTKWLLIGLFSFPAFGASLKCEPSGLAMFGQTKIESIRATAKQIVVEGESPLLFVPEPGHTQRTELKYAVSQWNWENGLTVSGLSTEITTGQHGRATIRLPGLKAPTTSPALRAYVGSLSLVPSSTLVRPRPATKISIRCFFRK
jgi:hypothetical protein